MGVVREEIYPREPESREFTNQNLPQRKKPNCEKTPQRINQEEVRPATLGLSSEKTSWLKL